MIEGRCVVERFWGQTLIYMPPDWQNSLKDTDITSMVYGVFPKDCLDKFGWNIARGENYFFLELPSVLSLEKNKSDYKKPDILSNKLQKYAKKK